MVDELLTRSAGELAALVRAGEVTARELTEAALGAIEAANGDVNAFVHVDAEGALAAADAIGPGDARPFAGVPFAIKDLRAAAGLPTTYGSAAFGDLRPGFDDNVSARLRAAGFVFVGVTNMCELGITATTEPRRYGPTRNPWDLGRTAGGSSGGSAAAVAAGMVPAAHGNDGGGSIRIPAACCGLVGLKPARGRVSLAPLLGQSPLIGEGALTRGVADTAAILDALAGPVTGDASWAPPPREPFAAAAARAPGRLRIGVAVTPAVACEVDPACAQAARDTGLLLERLGHDVEEIDPPWQDPRLFEAFADVFCTMLAGVLSQAAVVLGRPVERGDVEALTWAVHERARRLTALDFLRASVTLEAFARRIVAATDHCDAVVTPMLAEAPVPLGTIGTEDAEPWDGFDRASRFTPFSAIANITGQPAISLPLFEHPGGLPLGVQLVGRPADEATILALATQLESARPWAGRLAPLARGA